MTEFDAKRFAFAKLEDLNAHVVVFASDADGTGETIELQRSIEPDEQDLALGEETYCICLSGGATHYGGISSYVLSQRGLSLHLTEDAAAALEVDGTLQI